MTLKLRITRTVHPQEIADLVFGTGALGYPWWIEADALRDGKVISPWEDGLLETDTIRIAHWDGSTEGGRRTTELAPAYIVSTVSSLLNDDLIPDESANEMASEELGLADADAADIVLQTAVFGKIIYG